MKIYEKKETWKIHIFVYKLSSIFVKKFTHPKIFITFEEYMFMFWYWFFLEYPS